jgi:hypothetical protein
VQAANGVCGEGAYQDKQATLTGGSRRFTGALVAMILNCVDLDEGVVSSVYLPANFEFSPRSTVVLREVRGFFCVYLPTAV